MWRWTAGAEMTSTGRMEIMGRSFTWIIKQWLHHIPVTPFWIRLAPLNSKNSHFSILDLHLGKSLTSRTNSSYARCPSASASAFCSTSSIFSGGISPDSPCSFSLARSIRSGMPPDSSYWNGQRKVAPVISYCSSWYSLSKTSHYCHLNIPPPSSTAVWSFTQQGRPILQWCHYARWVLVDWCPDGWSMQWRSHSRYKWFWGKKWNSARFSFFHSFTTSTTIVPMGAKLAYFVLTACMRLVCLESSMLRRLHRVKGDHKKDVTAHMLTSSNIGLNFWNDKRRMRSVNTFISLVVT